MHHITAWTLSHYDANPENWHRLNTFCLHTFHQQTHDDYIYFIIFLQMNLTTSMPMLLNVLGNIFGIVKMIQTCEIAYFMDLHWCLRQCVVILTFRILHVVLCFKNFGGILSELLVECLPPPICYLIKLSCLTKAVSPIVTFRIMNLFKEQDNFVQYCQTVLEYDGGGHREGECYIFVTAWPCMSWAWYQIWSMT